MVNFAKKFKNFFLLAVVMLAFTLMPLTSIPAVKTSSSDLLENYNAFDSALMQMLDKYGELDAEVATASSASEENLTEINRLIVTTNSDIDDCGAVAKAEFEEYHIFQYSNAEDAGQAYDYFSSLDSVEVGYDFIVSTETMGSEESEQQVEIDASYTYNSWGASYIGYETYVNSMLSAVAETDLSNVVVAVLDSGINTSHVLFEGRILHAYARSWVTETVTTQYAYEDMCGHGTHVSGTIAEATLSNVKILPLKVLNAAGKGYVSSIVSAINYAITLSNSSLPGLKVMNMSIGVDDSSSADGESVSARSTSLTNAVVNAYNNGVLSVVSAGNENRNTAYAVPANVDCAITVSAVQQSYEAATGRNLVFHGQYIDSFGMSHWGYSNYGPHVDFAAPGTSITSAYIGSSTARRTENGTSMAAPHVTAAVALVYSNPDFNNYNFNELITLLRQNADKSQLHLTGRFPVSSGERDDYYGYGLISLKNIGILTSGYVEFSNDNQFATSEFSLSLVYDGEYDSAVGEFVKIYYTTDENVVSLDIAASNKTLYTTPFKVSKTTKITAVAYVYDAYNNVLKKSHSCSYVYYFDNIDLSANYNYETTSSGLVLTKYLGKLQTLKVQDKIGGVDVVAIDEGAFNDSKVKVLYLPVVDSFKFNSRAFYSNAIIEKVISESPSLQIGNEAFRYCSNLNEVSFANATKVGSFAFANNSKLGSLYLPYVTEIGQHAISGSGVKTLLVGQNIQTFDIQSNLTLEKIYGYDATVAETFAEDNDIDFYDLTLRITDDFSVRKLVKKSDGLVLELGIIGFSAEYALNSSISSVTSVMTPIEEYEYVIKLNLTNLTIGNYEISVSLTDKFGNKTTSTNTNVIVLSDDAETYNISFDDGDFSIFIDGELVNPQTELFEGYDYEIEVSAKAGYEIEGITLNNQSVSSPVSVEMLSEDLVFAVSTKEKEILDVQFYVEDGGDVLVDGLKVDKSTVARNSNFSFVIEPKDGYKIDFVLVNGEEIMSTTNVYTVEGVAQDLVIDVNFTILKYNVTVIAGKGGSVFRKGVLTDSTNVAYGSDLEFDIVCSEGYVVDFITVNGEKIQFEDNSFKIENINQHCEIIVSFKTATVSIFDGEHSAIFIYFMVFVVLFIVFVLAKVSLAVYRKKKKNK